MSGQAAILLAGGFGTRVRALYPDLPKPMIPVLGEPFLEWALRWWARQGATRVVVSLGHLADAAQTWLKSRPAGGPAVGAVVEREPLGTGGAAWFAAQSLPDDDPLWVANGDSLVLADLAPARSRLERDADLDGVLLGVEVEDASRYGSLTLDASGRLLGFAEKRPGRAVINAGVYLLRRRMLDLFPPRRPLSLETGVFPALLARGARLHVEAVRAPFLDIGTPESLAQAESFLRDHFS